MSWIYPQFNSGFSSAYIIFMIAIHSLDTSCTSSLSDCQATITVSMMYLLICPLMNRPQDMLYIFQWHTSLAAKWCSTAWKYWWAIGTIQFAATPVWVLAVCGREEIQRKATKGQDYAHEKTLVTNNDENFKKVKNWIM